jgi:hypothetical protein
LLDNYFNGTRHSHWPLTLSSIAFTHNTFSPTMSVVPQVKISTSDNEQFTVDREVVERSVLIKNMLEGNATASFFTALFAHFHVYRCR